MREADAEGRLVVDRQTRGADKGVLTRGCCVKVTAGLGCPQPPRAR